MTELPGLGLVYLNDPRSSAHPTYLLARLPFPTLFPLEYLAKHYDVEVRREGDTASVMLACRGGSRLGTVRVYWLDRGSGLPSRIRMLAIGEHSSRELHCRREGDALVCGCSGRRTEAGSGGLELGTVPGL